VVFVGQDPDVVLLVVLQRERDANGAVAEAKAFIGWEGGWRAPYWERVALGRWPGTDPSAAVASWQEAGGGQGLRLDWRSSGRHDLELKLRTPSQALRLESSRLEPAPGGRGPHGDLERRAGRGLLWVGEEPVAGVVVWEQLTGDTTARPTFGVFEMWVLAPEGGGLVWGRDTLGDTTPGSALRVSRDGEAAVTDFTVAVAETRSDAVSGQELPLAWSVEGLVLRRVGGELGRGTSPTGGPAVYDVSLAGGEGGQGLVFHLVDGL